MLVVLTGQVKAVKFVLREERRRYTREHCIRVDYIQRRFVEDLPTGYVAEQYKGEYDCSYSKSEGNDLLDLNEAWHDWSFADDQTDAGILCCVCHQARLVSEAAFDKCPSCRFGGPSGRLILGSGEQERTVKVKAVRKLQTCQHEDATAIYASSEEDDGCADELLGDAFWRLPPQQRPRRGELRQQCDDATSNSSRLLCASDDEDEGDEKPPEEDSDEDSDVDFVSEDTTLAQQEVSRKLSKSTASKSKSKTSKLQRSLRQPKALSSAEPFAEGGVFHVRPHSAEHSAVLQRQADLRAAREFASGRGRKFAAVTARDRDIEWTVQLHYGQTVADVQMRQSRVHELRYGGERVDMDYCDSVLVPKFGLAVLNKVLHGACPHRRQGSAVLEDAIMGPIACRKLREAWAEMKSAAEAGDKNMACAVRNAERFVPKEVTLNLEGTSNWARSWVADQHNLPDEHPIRSSPGKFTFQPRIVPDVPIIAGTLNVTDLSSLSSRETVQFLKRHIDSGDFLWGASCLDMDAENIEHGENASDVKTEWEERLVLALAAKFPNVVQYEKTPRLPGQPFRLGVVGVKARTQCTVHGHLACTMHHLSLRWLSQVSMKPKALAITDFANRAHSVVAGVLAIFGKPGARVSWINQNPEKTIAFIERGMQRPEIKLVGADDIIKRCMAGSFPPTESMIEAAYDSGKFDLSLMHELGYSQSEWRTQLEKLDYKAAHVRLEAFKAKMQRQENRLGADPSPEGVCPPVVVTLAEAVAAEPQIVHALLLSTHTGRMSKCEVAAWHHITMLGDECDDGTKSCDARRAAMLFCAQMAGGAVESQLAAFLTTPEMVTHAALVREQTEMQDDTRRPADATKGTGAYLPGPPGSTQGERVKQQYESSPGYQARPRGECVWNSMLRVFYEHTTWQILADEPRLASNYLKGDKTTYYSKLVAREDQLAKQRDAEPLQRRRYQGVDAVDRVMTALAHIDTAAYESIGTARAAILEAGRGHGVAAFLADKILLELLSSHLIESIVEAGDVSLGPGALPSVLAILDVLRGRPFRSSYKVKPSEVEDQASLQKWFDLQKFVSHIRRWMPSTMLAYWAVRKQQCVELQCLDKYMVAVLGRDPPVLVIENWCCEIGRRRAAALAYAALLIDRLPKGKLQLSRILSCENLCLRTLSTMQILVRIGDTIQFVSLSSLVKVQIQIFVPLL